MIEVLPTDKLFDDSPDTGTKECVCSRCGRKILEGEVPLRMFTTNEFDEVDEDSKEYRFCEPCQEASGITIYH